MLGDMELTRVVLLTGGSMSERKKIASRAGEILDGALSLVAPSHVPARWNDAMAPHRTEWDCVTFLQNLRVALVVPRYQPVSIFSEDDLDGESPLADILPDKNEYGMVVSILESPEEPEGGVVYVGGDCAALVELIKSFGGM